MLVVQLDQESAVFNNFWNNISTNVSARRLKRVTAIEMWPKIRSPRIKEFFELIK